MSKTLTEALAGKRRKAERYATEPDRFSLDSLSATMHSEHGNRTLAFEKGKWSCTCDFFAEQQTCSHVMALEIILSDFAGLHQSNQSEQE
jgi:hypothetical protein